MIFGNGAKVGAVREPPLPPPKALTPQPLLPTLRQAVAELVEVQGRQWGRSGLFNKFQYLKGAVRFASPLSYYWERGVGGGEGHSRQS